MSASTKNITYKSFLVIIVFFCKQCQFVKYFSPLYVDSGCNITLTYYSYIKQCQLFFNKDQLIVLYVIDSSYQGKCTTNSIKNNI